MRSLRLGHFSQALDQQQSHVTTYVKMSIEDRLSLLAQHEILCRQNTKIKRLVIQAKMRLDAHASHVDYRAVLGLRKDKVATLLSGQYLHYGHNITGQDQTFSYKPSNIDHLLI